MHSRPCLGDWHILWHHCDKLNAQGASFDQILAAPPLQPMPLVVLSADDAVAARSFRNLPEVQIIASRELNAYDVLVNDYIVFTQANLPTSAPAATEEAAQ